MAKVQLGPEYRKVFPVISSSSAVTEWQLHTEIVGIAQEDTGQHSLVSSPHAGTEPNPGFSLWLPEK